MLPGARRPLKDFEHLIIAFLAVQRQGQLGPLAYVAGEEVQLTDQASGIGLINDGLVAGAL
ncbi:hypothetical protein [Thermogemmatispora onikobensis]|uniref:hypothetical protein n=1 Tax=Thermogemmatispora onikobensis TaxID=732234 RepID=UPI00114D28B1|nr:hypothetical protein [Thermogemmatispora onikobensis]